MKRFLKLLLWRAAPGLAAALAAHAHRRRATRLFRRLGLDRVQKLFTDRHGFVTLAGPFAGMRYVRQSIGSVAVPKLVGSYESELHAYVERLAGKGYSQVVDVGAAEGYYAIGLARRLPRAEVVAFDTDPVARRLCAEMARLNGVADRVRVRGRCGPDELRAVLRPGALVVCDCEGYEAELLDPGRVPALASADLVVELHDGRADGTGPVVDRFRATHDVELVPVAGRDPGAYSSVAFLAPADRALALSELRPAPQRWAVLTARRASV